jgi:hypothetical protein
LHINFSNSPFNNPYALLFMDLVCGLSRLHKIITSISILVSGLCMLYHYFYCITAYFAVISRSYMTSISIIRNIWIPPPPVFFCSFHFTLLSIILHCRILLLFPLTSIIHRLMCNTTSHLTHRNVNM